MLIIINLLENTIFRILNFFGFGKIESLARSGKWKTTRKKHLEKEPFCQVCGTNKKLNVHHKIPVSIDPEKENDENNLITLCEHNNCHFLFGHLCNWSRYNVDVIADCKYWREKIKNEKSQDMGGSSEGF